MGVITPVDINNKEFKRCFRGYDVDDVDEFLDLIVEDYEKVYKENISLKEKLHLQNEKVEHYSKIEETIQNTLILAQNAAEQAKKAAQQEADLIIKNANDSSQRILDKAHNDVVKINDDYDTIKQEFLKFTNKFRNFMKSQLDMFESLEKDFVKNYNVGSPIEDIGEKNIEDFANDEKNAELDIKDFEENELKEDDLNQIKSFFAKED
ncbi:DivIVA domain-containing protein [Haloimpatiens massiliensis]|uniref:DivIVA domain-containing protein n=1 Tax=Haloimpatiens massiliensis TaxID=1658110 RepID=UPI000C824E9B|nr:DivIVA domain-containing protein [Haloimpatiens massiliensis]